MGADECDWEPYLLDAAGNYRRCIPPIPSPVVLSAYRPKARSFPITDLCCSPRLCGSAVGFRFSRSRLLRRLKPSPTGYPTASHLNPDWRAFGDPRAAPPASSPRKPLFLPACPSCTCRLKVSIPPASAVLIRAHLRPSAVSLSLSPLRPLRPLR